MQTFIDKLNILKGALILDGYEIDDACVKMVDRFIEAEIGKPKLDQLIEIVAESNLSQEEIAKRMQITQVTLSNICRKSIKFSEKYEKLFDKFFIEFYSKYERLKIKLKNADENERLVIHKKISYLLKKMPNDHLKEVI
jgi:transcriptional regulator with XRE-family HTH domain